MSSDQEQFYEKARRKHPDGNPPWRNAEYGKIDFDIISIYVLALKIVSYKIFVSFSIKFSDHEKVRWGSHNDPRLPNDCWTGILLLKYSYEWNIIVKKTPTQKMAQEISHT